MDRRGFGRAAGALALVGGASVTSSARAAAPAVGLAGLSITEACERVRGGQTTASALVDACLQRIDLYEPKLNAFITVLGDQARREAEAMDREQKAGKLRGPLHGVPISLKDNIDTQNERTTAGAQLYQMRVPTEDATAVAKLRAAGAIIIGKNNMNELAMSDGSNSFFGRVRNPWALDRYTGGSSSGSCAAVAADMVLGALGTDTGGSIRNPSAWCANVGLKPTSGLVSNRGTIPLSPSMDTIGPIAKTVADAALLTTVIAGYDPDDVDSVEHPREDYTLVMNRPVGDMRVGLVIGRFDSKLDPQVERAVLTAVQVIRSLVADVHPTELPDGGRAMALMPFGETYAWHEETFKALRSMYSVTDQATLDALADMKAADYIRARWEMERLRRHINDHFTAVDLMIYPTTDVLPFKLSRPMASIADGDPGGRGSLRYAGIANVLGIPAISVPCGFSREGLPIGLTICGPRFGEGKILALARAYEQAAPWRSRKPLLSPSTPVPPIPGAAPGGKG
jgi:aspartyl-tRNA(Asn)/glutamyl-tRNA(Gln) amidotransferase subunit A